MVSNISGLYNITTMYGLVEYANNSTGKILVAMFLISIFFILTMAFMRRSYTIDAIWASSFITFGMSIFFSLLGMLNVRFVIGLFVVFVFITFFRYTVQE